MPCLILIDKETDPSCGLMLKSTWYQIIFVVFSLKFALHFESRIGNAHVGSRKSFYKIKSPPLSLSHV